MDFMWSKVAINIGQYEFVNAIGIVGIFFFFFSVTLAVLDLFCNSGWPCTHGNLPASASLSGGMTNMCDQSFRSEDFSSHPEGHSLCCYPSIFSRLLKEAHC